MDNPSVILKIKINTQTLMILLNFFENASNTSVTFQDFKCYFNVIFINNRQDV